MLKNGVSQDFRKSYRQKSIFQIFKFFAFGHNAADPESLVGGEARIDHGFNLESAVKFLGGYRGFNLSNFRSFIVFIVRTSLFRHFEGPVDH